MKVFTIVNETNNIMVHGTMKEAEAVEGAERFRNEAGLAKLAATWPANRLVDIWNSLPGATPVKKFKDRGTAVARIWKAIQSLTLVASEEMTDRATRVADPADTATPDAPQTPEVAPTSAPAKVKATRSKKLPKPATPAKSARGVSKASAILDLLKRKHGATLNELMDATGWQAHSVRGFLSGTLRKKMGLNVESTKGEDGQRSYSVIA